MLFVGSDYSVYLDVRGGDRVVEFKLDWKLKDF